MGVIKKWFTAMFAKLIPNQSSTGSDAMHMGNVAGGVRISHTHVHNHFASAARPRQDRHVSAATEEHKAVLSLMDPLPEPVRIKVLKFMRREFKTTMVIDLQSKELVRLRAYVIKVRVSEGI